MMTCDKIRELILADHTDHELSAGTARLVTEHLAACPACAALAKRVRETAVDPFRGVQPVAPPPVVWERVKTGVRKRSLVPAFAAATVAAMLIATIVVVGYDRLESRALNLYIEEELAYLATPSETNGLGEYDVLSDMDILSIQLSSRRNFSAASPV